MPNHSSPTKQQGVSPPRQRRNAVDANIPVEFQQLPSIPMPPIQPGQRPALSRAVPVAGSVYAPNGFYTPSTTVTASPVTASASVYTPDGFYTPRTTAFPVPASVSVYTANGFYNPSRTTPPVPNSTHSYQYTPGFDTLPAAPRPVPPPQRLAPSMDYHGLSITDDTNHAHTLPSARSQRVPSPRKGAPAQPAPGSSYQQAGWRPPLCPNCDPMLLNPKGQAGPGGRPTVILFNSSRKSDSIRGLPLVDILALKHDRMDDPARLVLLQHPGPIWYQLNINNKNLRGGRLNLMEGNCEHLPNSRFHLAWYIAQAYQKTMGPEQLQGMNLVSFETSNGLDWLAVIKSAPLS